MEKDSTTIILICAIIFVILASIVLFLKISTPAQKDVKKITQQSTTTQTNKIQNNKTQTNKYTQDRVQNTNKTNNTHSTFLIIFTLICIAYIIIPIISYWKIYVENGESGFASIIPIYSQMVLYRIVGLKGWYVLLAFIPYVGTIISGIISLYATYLLAQKYEKGILFTFGLIILPFIFLPKLAFSELPRKYGTFYENY